MCRMIIHWHSCNHLVADYMNCPFDSSPLHEEETVTTALVADQCWACEQLAREQICYAVQVTEQMLFTIDQLEQILGVEKAHPDFLDMVARFYARGDHKNWGQPGINHAKYSVPDPYVDQLADHSYLLARGENYAAGITDYVPEEDPAMAKWENPLDVSGLNTDVVGVREPSEYFLLAINRSAWMYAGDQTQQTTTDTTNLTLLPEPTVPETPVQVSESFEQEHQTSFDSSLATVDSNSYNNSFNGSILIPATTPEFDEVSPWPYDTINPALLTMPMPAAVEAYKSPSDGSMLSSMIPSTPINPVVPTAQDLIINQYPATYLPPDTNQILAPASYFNDELFFDPIYIPGQHSAISIKDLEPELDLSHAVNPGVDADEIFLTQEVFPILPRSPSQPNRDILHESSNWLDTVNFEEILCVDSADFTDGFLQMEVPGDDEEEERPAKRVRFE
ncbi:hypothetical protein BDV25DRAFT_144852 [Aspergillus avenaceus]|uniref:Uncharacterized protein n=1 Tax=Aspergillus avenaceus TaxID=36643 RepID=A0A5N6TFZ4_ASPAV|nr:hypothetical protein BDV25DRAFT_144852 [Aspergillus avenaceus]